MWGRCPTPGRPRNYAKNPGGRRFGEENLQCLCVGCHLQKTRAREQRPASRRIKPTGCGTLAGELCSRRTGAAHEHCGGLPSDLPLHLPPGNAATDANRACSRNTGFLQKGSSPRLGSVSQLRSTAWDQTDPTDHNFVRTRRTILSSGTLLTVALLNEVRAKVFQAVPRLFHDCSTKLASYLILIKQVK